MSLATIFKSILGAKSPTITGAEARKLVADGALLVDVRSAAEFARKHLDGALHIPLADLPLGLPPDAKTVVLYCASGRRSRMAVARIGGLAECHDLGPMSAGQD